MPSPSRVSQFIATVEAADFIGALERFYVPDAFARENTRAPPRVGRDTLIAQERAVMARSAKIVAQHQGPALVSGNHVAIRWRFEFHNAAGGKVVLEEIAWQTWRDDLIAEEVFFYDPAQIAPASPA